MARHYQELLRTASHLLSRQVGQRGKLSNARIRRSISTSYYALFHFLLEEAGIRMIGSRNDLRTRRHILVRTFTHAGVKATLDKVKGNAVDQAVADFLRPPGAAIGSSVMSPVFIQRLAKVFLDAQAKRHDADYDLNKALSQTDARVLRWRVFRATNAWLRANTTADKDFKNALCALMLLQGRLRRD